MIIYVWYYYYCLLLLTYYCRVIKPVLLLHSAVFGSIVMVLIIFLNAFHSCYLVSLFVWCIIGHERGLRHVMRTFSCCGFVSCFLVIPATPPQSAPPAHFSSSPSRQCTLLRLRQPSLTYAHATAAPPLPPPSSNSCRP